MGKYKGNSYENQLIGRLPIVNAEGRTYRLYTDLNDSLMAPGNLGEMKVFYALCKNSNRLHQRYDFYHVF